jgi:hypothetical protein
MAVISVLLLIRDSHSMLQDFRLALQSVRHVSVSKDWLCLLQTPWGLHALTQRHTTVVAVTVF